jgi:hypothetical protein
VQPLHLLTVEMMRRVEEALLKNHLWSQQLLLIAFVADVVVPRAPTLFAVTSKLHLR